MSWSSVDYSGRWKALHYPRAPVLFTPLSLPVLKTPTNNTIALFVTSDLLADRRGQFGLWKVIDS